MKQIFLRRSKCSTEPKAVIMAQSSKEEIGIEPFWLTLCDAPYREIPVILRLRRCRGMRRTGTMVIAIIHRGPRKVVRLFVERRSSGMYELSCSHGSEGIRACDDASHTVTSREKIYIFPAAIRTVVSHSGDVPSPETPRSMTLYR